MAMLTSGEYSLSKKNVVHEKKSMLFVKLTDSAQRALNDYFHNLTLNTSDVPQIEFNKSEGRILIPTSPNSNANSEKCMAQFKFDVTSNMAMQGMQGRFDCVQHKRNTKQLIKFGQLTQRLRIHANEDVYETTKNRMAAIELEQRKNCTRQLDWNSAHMSRKVKLEKNTKPITTLTAPTIKSEEKETTKAVPMPEVSNVFRSKSRSVYNPPQKLNTNACKMRKPLRERLIQMLAVRPYKKIELYAALKQEGIRECDKPHLSDTLNSISTLRDNVYHLAKSAWNDVQEDWLFYSDQEKQLVKKNKLRNLTSPSSSDSGISTSSNQSPSNTSGEKSPPSSYKRPGYINGADGFLTKRQRISHFSRQESAVSSSKSASTSAYDENNAHLSQSNRVDACLTPSNPSSERSSSMSSQPRSAVSDYRSSEPRDTPPVVSSTTEGSPKHESFVEDEDNEISLTPTAPVSSSTTPPLPSINYDRDLQIRKFLQQPADSHPTNRTAEKKHVREKPKYMKEYVTITNMEQRRKYKSDFNEIFKEYTRVHEEIDGVSNIFAQLGESLRQHKKGTPKYLKIESEIFKKYYALKQSEKFTAAKRRFEYLHEKLSHIKRLVHEYDEKNNKD